MLLTTRHLPIFACLLVLSACNEFSPYRSATYENEKTQAMDQATYFAPPLSRSSALISDGSRLTEDFVVPLDEKMASGDSKTEVISIIGEVLPPASGAGLVAVAPSIVPVTSGAPALDFPVEDVALPFCPAITLAEIIKGATVVPVLIRGESHAPISRAMQYQIVNDAATVLAAGGPVTVSGSYDTHIITGSRMQFDNSLIDLLTSHKLFTRSDARFSGMVHFCAQSTLCQLNSDDRLFSLKIRANSFKTIHDSSSENDARNRIFDQTDLEDTVGRCQIDFNPVNSPLIVNMGQGVVLSDQVVPFDLTGDGKKENISCLREGAFLVLPNAAGEVRDINQLFGNNTIGPDQRSAANGFEAIAKYDDNNDTFISSTDAVYSGLRLWQDRDCNGLADNQELLNLVQGNVGRIDLQFVSMFAVDRFGNETRQRSVIEGLNGGLREIFDVWFFNQLSD